MSNVWTDMLDALMGMVWQLIQKGVDTVIELAQEMVESIWNYVTTANNGYLYFLLVVILMFAVMFYFVGKEMGVRGKIRWRARGYYRAKVKKQRYDPIWKDAKKKHYFEGGGK